MRFPARPSWRVSIQDKSPFTTALYVREAFGLDVAPDVPRLQPDVPLVGGLPGSAADWDRWWQAIVDAGTDGVLVVPPTGPDLLLAFERAQRDVSRWDPHRRPVAEASLVPTRLVNGLEKSLGRDASFSFFVDALPVTGVWHRDLSPTWLLISTDVWLDEDLFIPLLSERVAPLI